MANEQPHSLGSPNSNGTKPVASKNILNSCRTIEELERLTSQYTMICELVRGLPEEPCDKNMAAKLKNELVEIEALLRGLSADTAEAEKLKADLKEMMSDIKTHIWENMDNYLVNIALQSSKRGPSTGIPAGTPSKNHARSTDDRLSELKAEENPSSCKSRVVFCDSAKGDVENKEPTDNQKGAAVPVSVSPEEFSRVPDNLRGRLTVEKINETLNMVRDVTQRKYRLSKKRKGLTIAEKDALIRMRSEIVPAVRECRFISEEDVYFFTQKRLPRSTINQLCVLRHLKKIREVRDKNILRIILNS